MADTSEIERLRAEIISLESQLAYLAGAAHGVIDQMREIHDHESWPLKYRAPFAAIARLALVLDALPFPKTLRSAFMPGKGSGMSRSV